MLEHDITAEQARRNMTSVIDGPQQAIESLNQAIQTASEEHRAHTVVLLSRAHIDNDDLEKILAHFERRGFKVDDRCHDKDNFAMTISWYRD